MPTVAAATHWGTLCRRQQWQHGDTVPWGQSQPEHRVPQSRTVLHFDDIAGASPKAIAAHITSTQRSLRFV